MRGLAAVTFALVLAACSSGGDDEGSPAPLPSTGSEPVETAPPETVETDTAPEEDDGVTEPVNPGLPGPGGPVRLVEVASGLEAPVHAAAAPGEPDTLYVVEQPGRIRVLDDGKLRDEPFLDIVGEVRAGGEQGLLSVAFHPDYAANGLLYVNYTGRDGNTRVVEYRAAGGAAPAEQRELLFVEQPYRNHNGGQLAFGPDGLLYVGMGDGGSGGDPENRAQDLSSQLGKLLRLDVDDPGATWETVGLGLRNPWRFSFDRVTGDLWIGDVGQEEIEEVDLVPAAEVGDLHNFGWNVFEGSHQFRDAEPNPAGTLVEPVSEYTHRFGCSVTGGFVYRGRIVRQALWGRYLYGDYCSGRIWSMTYEDGETLRRGYPFRVPRLTSFAEDGRGEVFLLSEDGRIYRFARQ